MKPIPITLIVAATSSNGIGVSSTLPWRLPKEMAYFARITKECPEGSKNAVIMGRKSWDGIPNKFRPLPGRRNVVVSRTEGLDLKDASDSFAATSLDSATRLLSSSSTSASAAPLHRTFLIGGAQLYSLGLSSSPSSSSSFVADRILLTRVKTELFDAYDAFFPEFRTGETGSSWMRSSHEELVEYAGFEVPEGEQKEVDKISGKEVVYEFEMWVKKDETS